MRLKNTDPLYSNPLLERYVELAKPYELMINAEDFLNPPRVGLKIIDNGKTYGNYAEIDSVRNDLEIEKIIHRLKIALDENREEYYISTKLTESDKEEIKDRIRKGLPFVSKNKEPKKL